MAEKKIVGILPNNYVHVLDLVSGYWQLWHARFLHALLPRDFNRLS